MQLELLPVYQTATKYLANRLPTNIIPHLSRPVGERAKQVAIDYGLDWEDFPTVAANNPRGYVRCWPTHVLEEALRKVVADINDAIEGTKYAA